MTPDGRSADPPGGGQRLGDGTSGSPRSEASPPPQAGGHDLGFALPEPARLGAVRGIAAFIIVLGLLAAAYFFAYLPKRRAREALEQSTQTAARAAMVVDVVTPKVVASEHALVLPGSVNPLEETVVYSRADGYLKRWLVDIGDKVKEGQLLAEVETPELDQQLEQARALLVQVQAGIALAAANREFSRANLDRYKRLEPQGLATKEDLQQKQAQASVDEANVLVAQAAVGAQAAAVQRLAQLKSFARVVAPFAGTVTMRAVDRGALVTSGASTPLFKVSANDPVRVFIQVPQDVAPSVHPDIAADVTVREYAGRVFAGKVARAAGALDPASRTMSTEVRVPNPGGELLSGMYAEVALTLQLAHRVVEVPATALMNDANGLRVAIVDDKSRIRLVTVVVERDTGPTVQISSGLDGSERVVKLASASLSDGSPVEVLEAAK